MKETKIDIDEYKIIIYSLKNEYIGENFQPLHEIIFAKLGYYSKIGDVHTLVNKIHDKLKEEFFEIINNDIELYVNFEFELPLLPKGSTIYDVKSNSGVIEIYFTSVKIKQ